MHIIRRNVLCLTRVALPTARRNFCEQASKEQQQKQRQRRDQSLVLSSQFENVNDKSKSTFLQLIDIYDERNKHRRGHVEFIYAALKNLEMFNCHKDLEVYKALLNVMPKGKFIPQNIFQAEFQHYPKQQQCIIDLLEQMEDNGVIPDYEMEDMLVNVFGRKGHPVRKFWRMMYWMPKFKNASPWPLPNPVPDEVLELARLAVERMCTVDVQSKVTVYQTADVESAVDDTWIVSGQSPGQQKLMTSHKKDVPLHIEGPFLIWLRDKSINYFTLRGDPPPNMEVVEDEDMDGELKHYS
jgi:evolutionarily conserved signaling intermediate in Toll pathway